ncbi:hypothetical protein R3P38DRAFT_2765567 [Favolaschia claudopus]|uniref:Uncharacterized protein n=1 Tax=Favolaschia claudopus TaxID=2862362 RepID=A0AAW0D8P0_9AGAR
MAMTTRNKGKRAKLSQPGTKTTTGKGRKSAATKPPPAHRSPSPAASPEPEQGSEYEENHDEEEEDREEEEDDCDEEEEDDGDGESGEVTQNAQNARSQHWQPWQDRVLVQQANTDRPFLLNNLQQRATAWTATADAVNATISKTATRPWTPRSGEACRKCLQRLIAKFKTREAESLQKTGTNEEVTEFMHVLGELSALADGEVVASSRKVKTKQGLEAAMKGLVKSDRLCDLSSVDSATARERQGQRGTKRKNDENSAPSANATNKRRKNNLGALHEVLNTRLEQDEAELRAPRKEDEVRHNAHIEALKVMTETLANVNEGLRSMHDQQQKTNALLEAQELHRREEQIRRREQELGISK